MTKTMQRWIVAGVATLLLGAGGFLFAVLKENSDWHFLCDVTDWRFGHYIMRRNSATLSAGLVMESYQLGPVELYHTYGETPLAVLPGTNKFQVGVMLYSGFEHRKIGRIVRIDNSHLFEDGRVGPGVLLVQWGGHERWFLRENLWGAVGAR